MYHGLCECGQGPWCVSVPKPCQLRVDGQGVNESFEKKEEEEEQEVDEEGRGCHHHETPPGCVIPAHWQTNHP